MMAYEWDDDCVSCEICRNCGRGRFKAYYCDKCGEYGDELYVGINGEELCEDCYKEQFNSKICDDLDEDHCDKCGADAEELFDYGGEWLCSSCLMEQAERVDTE